MTPTMLAAVLPAAHCGAPKAAHASDNSAAAGGFAGCMDQAMDAVSAPETKSEAPSNAGAGSEPEATAELPRTESSASAPDLSALLPGWTPAPPQAADRLHDPQRDVHRRVLRELGPHPHPVAMPPRRARPASPRALPALPPIEEEVALPLRRRPPLRRPLFRRHYLRR